MRERDAVVTWRSISLVPSSSPPTFASVSTTSTCITPARGDGGGDDKGQKEWRAQSLTGEQLIRHPLALLALIPNSVALFSAGALSGAAAKTVTAPLDRVKLLMQTHIVRAGPGAASKSVGFVEAITNIGKTDGIKGYWKGNFPQVFNCSFFFFLFQTFAHPFSSFMESVRV
jgi:Mitochondrial carrier protein